MFWRMLVLFQLIFFTTHVARGEICPPSCIPPKIVTGCKAYRSVATCTEQGRDLSISEGQCSCHWKSYIQFVEPLARVIFTENGEQCYVWATSTCSAGNASVDPIKEILMRLEHLETRGIAKHRRRNGVDNRKSVSSKLAQLKKFLAEDIKNGDNYDFIGKATRHSDNMDIYALDGSSEYEAKYDSWVEAKRQKAVPMLKNATGLIIIKDQRAWLGHFQDDKFKLCVFASILLLNILLVFITICCRSEKKQTPKEVRAAGDLDPNAYLSYNKKYQDKPSPFRRFLAKLTGSPKKKAKKNAHFLNLERGDNKPKLREADILGEFASPSRYDERGSSYKCSTPRRQSRGLYENVFDLTNELDHTYEEPIFNSRDASPNSRDVSPRRYSARSYSSSDGQSPTKYSYIQDAACQTERDFKMPSGIINTLESPGKKKGRKGWKPAALLPIRAGLYTGN